MSESAKRWNLRLYLTSALSYFAGALAFTATGRLLSWEWLSSLALLVGVGALIGTYRRQP